jgi:hypothetical protein
MSKFLFIICWVSSLIHASCNLTASEWNHIKTALVQRNFYEEFRKVADCQINANGTGLLTKYGDCASTLSDVVATQNLEPGGNCVSALTSVVYSGYGRVLADVQKVANDMCLGAAFGKVISDDDSQGGYLCYPLKVVGCPRGVDGECENLYMHFTD